MGLALVATSAFALWVILASLGVKSFDGFLLALLIILIAVAMKIAGGRASSPD